jgi:hypothetical protein
MLSKKHYIRIAEILKTVKTEHNKKCIFTVKALEDLENRLVQYFSEDNPRFDNWRFKRASSVLEEKELVELLEA